MDTKNQIENDLKDAIRAGDNLRKITLRSAMAAMKLSEVQKGKPLDDNEVSRILQKEIKSYQETISDSQTANRPDLVDTAKSQISILEKYLPASLSDEELEALTREVIGEVNATSPADMGKVMKALMGKIQGRATGDRANQIVRRLLS